VRGAWSSILPSITALVRSIGHRVTVPYNRTLSSGLQGFDFRLQFGSMSTRSFVGLRRHLLKRGLVVPMRNHLLTEWDMGSHEHGDRLLWTEICTPFRAFYRYQWNEHHKAILHFPVIV
jgi:hypothetical protein